MTDTETDFNEETDEKKPRRTRKRNEERRVFVYRMIDGKPKEQGAFPETVIGTPLERRSPVFLRELFGEGDYRMEIRKPNGHFERAFDISIAAEADRADRERQNIIEVEPEEFDDEAEEFSSAGNTNTLELLLMKERLKAVEAQNRELRQSNDRSQSEMVSMMQEVSAQNDKSFERALLLAQLLAPKAEPKTDATAGMFSILSKMIDAQRGLKEFAKEMMPNGESSESNNMVDSVANLIDTVGNQAEKFAPVIVPLIMSNAKPAASPGGVPTDNQAPSMKHKLAERKAAREAKRMVENPQDEKKKPE